MKTEFTYYKGENASLCFPQSKKLVRRYRGWTKLKDEDLLVLLEKVNRLAVVANAHGGSVDLNWHGDDMEGDGKAWMILSSDEDEWIKLFLNALPRLRELLIKELNL